MTSWPRFPTIYEINTWVWLFELGQKMGRPVDLRSVPSQEWAGIAAYGFDAVWLMGVWQRSPSSVAISNRNKGLLEEFKRALPDFHPQDNIGSAYSVRAYTVDQALGGPEGLAVARSELAKRGIRLILERATNTSVFRRGNWTLSRCTGWPDNSTYQNLVAWSWIETNVIWSSSTLATAPLKAAFKYSAMMYQEKPAACWTYRPMKHISVAAMRCESRDCTLTC